MMMEKESWPYDFALSEDFQKTEQRGCISGRLLVRDRYSIVAFLNILQVDRAPSNFTFLITVDIVQLAMDLWLMVASPYP
jgi:hypothetical protein